MLSSLLKAATDAVGGALESIPDMDELRKEFGTSTSLERTLAPKPPDFTYVTERVIAMGFPASKDTKRRCRNRIEDVARYLKERHDGKFMVWNLSEESYDYSLFDDQVLQFNFPGHPAPPLGLFFKVCTSIENWLLADEANVAVVHCLTGKGRTATVVACLLAWMGVQPSPMEALQLVAEKRGIEVERLSIPSQRRYVQYFTNMLDGVKPRSDAVLLRRIIVNGIPRFLPQEGGGGCRPYVQLFKSGKLLFATTWKAAEEGGIKTYFPADGSFSFNIDAAVQGDMLLRCRHVTDERKPASMFRAGFHSGYVPSGILRLTKSQLDGACEDDRFPPDFFIDLIFAPLHALPAPLPAAGDAAVAPTAADDSYDAMVAAKSSFWDEVARRRERARLARGRVRESSASAAVMGSTFAIGDDSDGEDDTDDLLPSDGGGGGGGGGGSGSGEEEAEHSDDKAAAAFAMEDVTAEDGGSTEAAADGTPLSATAEDATAGLSYLDELAQLEKELGLTSEMGADASSGLAGAEGDDAVADLDMGDLDAYLASLDDA